MRLSYFGSLPQVAPVFYFKECLRLFSQIPILIAQNLAFQELKKRNKITKTNFESIPNTLKSIVYFAHLANKIPIIENLLQSQYQGG